MSDELNLDAVEVAESELEAELDFVEFDEELDAEEVEEVEDAADAE